jgi:pimeloyl-ACP methyl ester carboxylesterase
VAAVIAVDLPGLGAPTAPAAGYDKATTTRRIHEAMAGLGVTRVTLVGHDVGRARRLLAVCGAGGI